MPDKLVSEEELKPYARLYDDIMSGAVDAANHRHDLGSHVEKGGGRRENICQVMWPSLYLSVELSESVLHTRVIHLARQLLGILEIRKLEKTQYIFLHTQYILHIHILSRNL